MSEIPLLFFLLFVLFERTSDFFSALLELGEKNELGEGGRGVEC